MFEVQVNQPYTTLISGPPSVTPTPYVFANGQITSLPISTTAVAGSVWMVTFTPTTSGVHTVVAFDAVQDRIVSVQRLSYSMLANIEDEALGSWQWDKQTGTLTLLRKDGSSLASYLATDTISLASRELQP